MAIIRSKAKALCTAAELALVDASGPKSIGELSGAQLRQKVGRARKLADKWRDQAESQRRTAPAKAGGRQTDAAARSAEKAQLFTEVLQRFEARLAKTEVQSATSGSSRKESSKKVRNRQHRATRATVRGDLAESRLELAAKKSARPKPVKKSGAASAPPAAEAEVAAPPKVPGKRKPAIIKSKKAPVGSASAPETRATNGKQLAVATRAKQKRLQAAGIKRMQKHASARNKRNQAKRDSR